MSRSRDIVMNGVRLDPDLRIGCVHLANADSLPLASAFVELSAAEVSITFWGATPEPWDGATIVSIRMFRLPRGRAEFQRDIDFFSEERRKRSRLPEGVAFGENTLAIGGVPARWVHDGFARSNRDFIHIYRSDKLGILIRYLGKAGDILDNPLLRPIHENLRIVEDQWIVEFPETRPQGAASSTVTETPLPDEVQSQVREAVGRARERLQLGRIRDPRRTAEAIHRAIDEFRERQRVPAEEKKQFAIDLGALWGEALCRARKWEWCCVSVAADQETFAVCSPGRSHAVDPLAMVYRILSSRRVANNALLLFNMILSGHLPAAADRKYCWLS